MSRFKASSLILGLVRIGKNAFHYLKKEKEGDASYQNVE